MVDLVTVGDLMVDILLAQLKPGKALHAPVRMRVGGSAANAAVWAAAAGATVKTVGRVGNDVGGVIVARSLADAAITPLLAIDRDEPTGVFVAAPRGTVVAERGANARLAPADVEQATEAGLVLLSGYLLLNHDTEEAAITAIANAGDRLVIDAGAPGLLQQFGTNRFLDVTRSAGILLISAEEARVLTGAGPSEAARILGALYSIVCVKLGDRGVIASIGKRVGTFGVPALERRNRIGCGDAFAGGMLAALARNSPIDEAITEGCRAGALAASGQWPT